MSGADPLLVTLRCAGPGWSYCEELRDRHFPPSRKIVPAHLMLFHHLPGEKLEEIMSQAKAIANATPAFSASVNAVRSLGRGVAFAIGCPELLQIHRALSGIWAPWLIAQDRARYSPHITIQNKVTSGEAQQLLASLQVDFKPFAIDAGGIDIWHYRSGPWEHAAFLGFSIA